MLVRYGVAEALTKQNTVLMHGNINRTAFFFWARKLVSLISWVVKGLLERVTQGGVGGERLGQRERERERELILQRL